MALFDNAVLSTENNEPENGVNVDEQIIEGNEAYGEALELASEARLDAEDMMSAERAVIAMEHKLSNEEHLIANPEKITAELVTVANESYLIVASMLGAEAHQVEGVLSSESIESSPISAFQVSHEGAKDFLKKLYESIKLLFKKIGNAIKKVVVKLVVAMNGVEKAADKLLKAVNKNTNSAKESKLPESDNKAWQKYFTAVAGVSNSKTYEDYAKFALSYYVTLDENLNLMVGEFETLSKVISATSSDNTVTKKIGEVRGKIVKKTTEGGLIMTKLNLDSNETIIPVALVNDKVKGLLISGEDTNDDKKELKLKVATVKVDTSLETNVEVLEKNKLAELIGEVKNSAKGLKAYSDKRTKEIDAMYKVLDKNAEDKTDGAVSKFLLKQKASFGTNVRALVAGVYLDSVLAYSSATKKVLAFCNDQAKLYKSNEL